MTDTKILVVEDEAVTSMDLRSSLTDLGYAVCAIATTGETAVKTAGALHPDIILMDIMLAGKMTGIDAAEIIRSKYHIPVIYLTAYSDDSFLARAKITEPFGYILKPFRELELKTNIEMALYKHQMESALRVSEETTRVLLNAIEDAMFLVDVNGRFQAVNAALANQAGKTVKELIGSNVSELVIQGFLSQKMAGWNVNATLAAPLHFEEEFKGKWFDVTLYPVRNPDDNVVLFAVYIRNITPNKKLEEQSRQNEEYFRSLVEGTSDIIAILNRDGTLRYDSPSITRSLGYAGENLVGKSLSGLLHEDELPKLKSIFQEIMSNPGMVKPFNLKVKNAEGEFFTMEGIISNLYGNPVIDGIVLNGWIKNHRSP
nr:PAS domain S-box protein [uncultured Methanoregula sp.]